MSLLPREALNALSRHMMYLAEFRAEHDESSWGLKALYYALSEYIHEGAPDFTGVEKVKGRWIVNYIKCRGIFS